MAKEIFRSSGRESYKFASQYVVSGRSYLEVNDYNGAIREFEKAVSSNPVYVEGHFLLGEAYFSKAIKDDNLAVGDKSCLLKNADKHFHKVMLLASGHRIAGRAFNKTRDIFAEWRKV